MATSNWKYLQDRLGQCWIWFYFYSCIFRCRHVLSHFTWHPRKPMCTRWIRVSTLLLVHRLIYKYFRFTGPHFEFSLIVLHRFSDTWQLKDSDLILSKFQICLHFSGMCVLFFTRFRFIGRHLDFRVNGRLRRMESGLTPLKSFHWKHRGYRHRSHVVSKVNK